MRFGITPIRVESITDVFDQGKGLAGFLNFRYSDMVIDAVERGYEHIEITMDLFQVLPIPVDDAEITRLKNIKKEYDITYSAHFPIWSIELSSPNKFIREASVQSLVSAFNTFKFLESDIDVYIIHPTGALTAELMNLDVPEKYKNVLISLFANFAIQGIKSLIKATKIDISKIAIENIEFPFEGTLDIIKKLKGSKLCIDTAHFLGGYSGNVDLVDIAEKYLDITSEIHLQDFNAGGGADHAALGTGKFPFEFLKIVQEFDFKGPINFELTFAQAKQSLGFIKKHLPEIKLPTIK